MAVISIVFLLTLFLAGFFINLLYELLHSLLYTTCLNAPLQKYVYLMLKAAIFDGLAIALIYYIVRGNVWLFVIAALVFAYAWEWHSLREKKWEYSAKMPRMLGVGATPLFQLAFTGLLSLYIVFHF